MLFICAFMALSPPWRRHESCQYSCKLKLVLRAMSDCVASVNQ